MYTHTHAAHTTQHTNTVFIEDLSWLEQNETPSLYSIFYNNKMNENGKSYTTYYTHTYLYLYTYMHSD